MDLPRIISVDDHVVEPPHVWQEHLPEKLRDRGPRIERVRGVTGYNRRHFTFDESDDCQWGDRWVYDGITMPITEPFVSVCFDREPEVTRAVLFDEILRASPPAGLRPLSPMLPVPTTPTLEGGFPDAASPVTRIRTACGSCPRGSSSWRRR